MITNQKKEIQSGRQGKGQASGLVMLGVIFATSGFAGLTYQIIWQRKLFLVFGVDITSVSLVVTIFMLGLGVGAFLGGVMADWSRRQCVRHFCLLEFFIGLFGVFSFSMIGLIASTQSQALMIAQSAALLLIPTVMMGATLPLLSVAMIDAGEAVGEAVGTLYYWNTFGAALACGILGFVFFSYFGLQHALWLAVSMNALAVLGGLWFSRARP